MVEKQLSRRGLLKSVALVHAICALKNHYTQDQLDNCTTTIREKIIPITLLSQGDTNNCGTACTEMIGQYLGCNISRAQINQAINPTDLIGTNPQDIQAYLGQLAGVRSQISQNTELTDVVDLLEADTPPIVLIDPNNDGADATLHYVIINGYRSVNKSITEVCLTNPGGKGRQYWEPIPRFLNKWTNLNIKNIATDINRLAIWATNKPNLNLPGNPNWSPPLTITLHQQANQLLKTLQQQYHSLKAALPTP